MASGAEVQDQQWLDLIGLSLANYAYIYVLIIFSGGGCNPLTDDPWVTFSPLHKVYLI